MTTVLVVGATGRTGRLVVARLLGDGHAVRVIVRAPERLPDAVRTHPRLSVTGAAILALDEAALAELARGCGAVVSCLGHTISWRGIFGPPRRLVAEATRRLCRAIQAHGPGAPVKFVLMSSVAVRNRDPDEPLPVADRCAMALFRLLPPQADNEEAVAYLRTGIGPRDGAVAWVAVRPDTLTDAEGAGDYQVHPSPTRSGIFNPGTTRRAHVAHFIAGLIADEPLWRRWQGRMPVVYDDGPPPARK